MKSGCQTPWWLRIFFFLGTPDSWARLPLHWTTELERPVQTRLAGLSRDDHFRYMKQSCEFILIGYSIKFWNTFTTVSSTMSWSKFVLGCMTEIILPWGTDKHVLIKNVHKITGGSPNSTRLGPHKALLSYKLKDSRGTKSYQNPHGATSERKCTFSRRRTQTWQIFENQYLVVLKNVTKNCTTKYWF